MKKTICEEKNCERFQIGKTDFCQIGYKQNPATEEAVAHSLSNNAEVCSRLIELLLYRKDKF